MQMLLIWVVAVLYFGQAGVFAWQGNGWLALVYGGYAVANIGLVFGAGGS